MSGYTKVSSVRDALSAAGNLPWVFYHFPVFALEVNTAVYTDVVLETSKK